MDLPGPVLFGRTTTAPPIKAFSLIYFLSGFYSEQVTVTPTRYRYYCLVTDCLIFVVLFATVYQLLTSRIHRESLSVSFVVCIAYSLTLYYSVCFRIRSAKILEVICLMGQARASLAETLGDGSVYEGFEKDVKNNQFYTRFGTFASFTSAFLFSVQPLMRSSGIFGMDGSKQLQIDIWCPFDYKLPILFESIVLLQFCTVFVVAIRFFANDSFYMFLIQVNIRYFGHFTSLGENVFRREHENWRHHERMCDGTMRLKLLQPIEEENGFIEDNTNNINVSYHREDCLTFNEEFNSSAEEKLKLFIKHHQLVLSCSQKVCELYGPVMLMYLLSLMGFASVGAFGVIHTNGFEGVQSIGVSFFSITNLVGMYFMCKAGDDLADKSGDAASELVGAGWFVCSRRVASSLATVLQRVAARVQACVVGTPSMPLTCNTFAWFIKTLVSFYLFLVQVQGVKNV